ncbi:flagellar export chaperone FliS [Alkalihalobacillus trypoxylicola]|nr:flagellar export chaperone FliS [Alkalihalobacillus trypoxylicola]
MVDIMTDEWLYHKTPQQLTSLLYEACYNHLEDAKTMIKEKDYIGANERLQKANDVIHRLGVGINYEAGILSDQLEQIYQYMADRLIVANLKKDLAIIDEVQKMIEEIMNAWNTALKVKKDRESTSVKLKKNRYEQQAIYE